MKIVKDNLYGKAYYVSQFAFQDIDKNGICIFSKNSYDSGKRREYCDLYYYDTKYFKEREEYKDLSDEYAAAYPDFSNYYCELYQYEYRYLVWLYEKQKVLNYGKPAELLSKEEIKKR